MKEMKVAYIPEDNRPSNDFLTRMGAVSYSPLEERVPGVTVEKFNSISDAVGANWDGPLFTEDYNLIVMGILYNPNGSPIKPEECNYGRRTGLIVLNELLSRGVDADLLVTSMVRESNIPTELKELKQRAAGVVNLEYLMLPTLPEFVITKAAEMLKKRPEQIPLPL